MAERGLQLRLSTQMHSVLCGETLPVEVVVHNAGRAPVTLTVGPGNPIVFEFRSLGAEALVHRRSRLIALRQALGDRVKPLPPDESFVVQPGESSTRYEDPAAGSVEPLPAGHYALTAGWTLQGVAMSTQPVEVTIEAPNATRLASLYCAFTGSQAQAFDHRVPGTPTSGLFERDTASQSADASVFARRAEVPGWRDLTLAVHVAPQLSGRWLAWLREQSIGAVACLGAHTSARPAPTAVNLGNPLLVDPAFQRSTATPSHPIFDCGEALLLVVGERDGETRVQAFVATAESITAGPVAPLGARAPARVLARAALASGEIRLVWAETAPGGTRICMRPCSRELQPLSAEPRLLFETSAPLLAIEMDPIDDGRSPGYVHALFGPANDTPERRQLAYVRIPLEPHSPAPQPWAIAQPAHPAEAYAISGATAGGFMVLAKIGSEIWRVAAAGAGSWQVLINDVPALTQLRLATAPSGYWAALGIDPLRGVVCVKDPDFSHER